MFISVREIQRELIFFSGHNLGVIVRGPIGMVRVADWNHTTAM